MNLAEELGDAVETRASVLRRLHEAEDLVAAELGIREPVRRELIRRARANELVETRSVHSWLAALAAVTDWQSDLPPPPPPVVARIRKRARARRVA